MPRTAAITPIRQEKGWMVSVPKSLSSTGERVRRFFPSYAAAEKFAARIRGVRTLGIRNSLISTNLAMQAVVAARILEGSGLTLQEAARIAMAAGATTDLTETFGERFDRATAAGERIWSIRYARDMDKVLRWLGKGARQRKCAEMSVSEIDRLLAANGAKSITTLQMRRSRVLAILNFRDRPRRTAGNIRLATVAEIARLLRSCERPDERRTVALLAFAGIRPDSEDGEISRLQWDTITATEIYVPPEVSKTRTDRHIPITPRLARLLRGRPDTGPVMPPGWKRAWQRLRRAAGIDGQDTLRHAFASHFLAAYGEHPAKLAMGHTAGSDTLFRHYRRAVTPAAGRTYFGIK